MLQICSWGLAEDQICDQCPRKSTTRKDLLLPIRSFEKKNVLGFISGLQPAQQKFPFLEKADFCLRKEEGRFCIRSKTSCGCRFAT
jgi:hypothetical protein